MTCSCRLVARHVAVMLTVASLVCLSSVPGRGQDPKPADNAGADAGAAATTGFDGNDTVVDADRPMFRGRANRGGGKHPGDENVKAGLQWLADHQSADGCWSPADYGAAPGDKRPRGQYDNRDGSKSEGAGMTHNIRIGVTGLSLLAFMGAGSTHLEGEYKDVVRAGLKWLHKIQSPDGRFDDTNGAIGTWIYGHAIGTLTMVEAWAMTRSRYAQESARKGVEFACKARNVNVNADPRKSDGWRYGIRPGDSDGSVTAWMTLALCAARDSGLDVPADALNGAIRMLDSLTGPKDGHSKTGYVSRAGDNARIGGRQGYVLNSTMNAINIAVHLLASGDVKLRKDRVLQDQAKQLATAEQLPAVGWRTDYYYWHYGTLAVFHMGDRALSRAWDKAMLAAVTACQRLEGDATCRSYGSWDTTSPWGEAGGRVYTTAINCLTLETPYRCEKLPGRSR